MVAESKIAEVSKDQDAGQPCRATNERGELCSAPTGAGSEYCFWHDPARGEKRAEARKKGGYNRRRVPTAESSEPVEVRSCQDILGLVQRGINDTLSLENSIARSRALGYLAGVALKALEVGEFAERLKALEKAVLDGSSCRVPVGEIPIVRGSVD